MLGDCANSMLVRRPHWHGSINKLLKTHESKIAELVGAAVPFEHFKKVSGVPATKAAIKRLNGRLAARGAPASSCAAAPRRISLRRHACYVQCDAFTFEAPLALTRPCCCVTLDMAGNVTLGLKFGCSFTRTRRCARFPRALAAPLRRSAGYRYAGSTPWPLGRCVTSLAGVRFICAAGTAALLSMADGVARNKCT